MDCSVSTVSIEFLHLNRLEYDSLSGHRSIAVDDHRQNQSSVWILEVVLFGSSLSYNDRINGFEMARIWQQSLIKKNLQGLSYCRCGLP